MILSIIIPLILFEFAQIITASQSKFRSTSIAATFTCVDSINNAILKSTDPAVLREHLSVNCGDHFRFIDASKIFLQSFNYSNEVLFDILIEFGACPFKMIYDSQTRMNAYDFIILKGNNRVQSSEQQNIIRKLKEMKERQSGPVIRASEEFLNYENNVSIKFWAKYDNWEGLNSLAVKKSIPNFNLNYRLDDGSNLLHQTIVGNNSILFETILMAAKQTPSEFNINDIWLENSNTQTLDVFGQYGIKPVGWTPLMLAVALNRNEMVSELVQVPGIDLFFQGPDMIDVKILARSLPNNSRMKILKLLRMENPEWADKTCQSYESYKEAIMKSPTNDSCLNYQSWKYGEADDEAAKAAIIHLDVQRMAVVLKEWNHKLNSKELMQILWTSLKEIKQSNADELSKKLALLAGLFKMKLDQRELFNPAMTPWEEVLTSPEGINENLMTAMLLNTTMFNINRLNAYEEDPLVIAFENNNIRLINILLQTHNKNGYNIDKVNNAQSRENILHLAIIHMSDESLLIKVVQRILKLRPSFLNVQSFLASVNSARYQITVSGEFFEYQIIRRSGWTPLMYAIALRKDKVAQFLIKQSADITKIGLDGVSASSIATERYNHFLRYYNDWRSCPSSGCFSMAKLVSNQQNANKIVKMIKKELNEKYKW